MKKVILLVLSIVLLFILAFAAIQYVSSPGDSNIKKGPSFNNHIKK